MTVNIENINVTNKQEVKELCVEKGGGLIFASMLILMLMLTELLTEIKSSIDWKNFPQQHCDLNNIQKYYKIVPGRFVR